MRAKLLIPAAALLIAACDKSTGPTDPYAGGWSVMLPKFADSTYFTPSPFTLTITNVGGAYVANLPNLVYHLAAGTTVGTYAITNDSTEFDITDGFMTLRVGGSVTACNLTITGPISGNLANGAFGLPNGCGPNANETGSWSAAKQ